MEENITIAIMTVAFYYCAAFVKTLNSLALTDNYALASHCRMCYKIHIHGMSFKFQMDDNFIFIPTPVPPPDSMISQVQGNIVLM